MKTILIVEDDPINVLVLYDFLTAHGYRTTVDGMLMSVVYKDVEHAERYT